MQFNLHGSQKKQKKPKTTVRLLDKERMLSYNSLATERERAMDRYIHWATAEPFHAVRKVFRTVPDLSGSLLVNYRAKVKLYGTDAAIQCLNGRVICQDYKGIIMTPEHDNVGFAEWVKRDEESWAELIPNGSVVFGEWCEPGIQKKGTFAIFGMMDLEQTIILIDPKEIRACLVGDGVLPRGAKIIPWHCSLETNNKEKDLPFEIMVNWGFLASEEHGEVLEKIDEEVRKVEQFDPWVKSEFGVSGTREGLIFYPISFQTAKEFTVEETFLRIFKAKREIHGTVIQKMPA